MVGREPPDTKITTFKSFSSRYIKYLPSLTLDCSPQFFSIRIARHESQTTKAIIWLPRESALPIQIIPVDCSHRRHLCDRAFLSHKFRSQRISIVGGVYHEPKRHHFARIIDSKTAPLMVRQALCDLTGAKIPNELAISHRQAQLTVHSHGRLP